MNIIPFSIVWSCILSSYFLCSDALGPPCAEFLQNRGGNFLRRLCLIGDVPWEIQIEGINVRNCTKESIECDVIVELKNRNSSSLLNCPGDCHPTPTATVELIKLFRILHHNIFSRITCASSFKDLVGQFIHTNETDDQKVSKIFEIIYYRRIMECREQARWPIYLPRRYNEYRQSVEGGLFIWVGTNSEMDTLYLQQSVLPQYHEKKGVIKPVSWLATEDVYPCSSRQSILCKNVYFSHENNNTYYMPFMPETGREGDPNKSIQNTHTIILCSI